ncbi:MAG: DUF502 domain-containing protein [Pseudomonadota bacterium]
MARGKDKQKGLLGDSLPRQSLFGWLRGRFFAGMVIAAPITVTFLVLQFLINEIDKRVVPLIPEVMKPETYLNYAVPGFGVLVLVIALTILGAVGANLIGRSVIGLGDRILSRIPLVKNLYAALKQLFDVLANNNTAKFNRVVLVEYPKKGSWCIGFVSAGARGEIKTSLGEDFIGVFVPTTPNPTSGFLIYVHASEMIDLDMSVEEGAKMILSAGLVVPDHPVDEAMPEAIQAAPSALADQAKPAAE